jgi:hypothetical protein
MALILAILSATGLASTIQLSALPGPKIIPSGNQLQNDTSNCYVIMPGGVCTECSFGFYLSNYTCVQGD